MKPTHSDERQRLIVTVLIAVVALTASVAISFAPLVPAQRTSHDKPQTTDRARHAATARAAEVQARFKQAVVMLHAKRFDDALTALHRVLELQPNLPEAHVNIGFALLGSRHYLAGRDFFNSAIALRPAQANAYYGLALAEEQLGNLPAAVGAMRTYIHLSRSGDPYVRKARAALWEWEVQSRTPAKEVGQP